MTAMENGNKVFIAGSRRLSRLSGDVRRRIDNIIEKGLTVIVGDANGADRAVQRYLSAKGYGDVVVFCMEDRCRNNIGSWPTRTVKPTKTGRRDFAYYSAKDRAMAEEAHYGLMLWDGHSRGTLTNIVDLVRKGKPVAVYVASDGRFYRLKTEYQLADLLHRFDPAALQRVDRELEAVAAGGGPGATLIQTT
jgi:hypothetical protein